MMKILVILPILFSQLCLASHGKQPDFSQISKIIATAPTFTAESKAVAVQYTFLCATNHNITTGETYAFSNVIAIPANLQGLEREEVIEKFAEELQEKFPQSTFDISMNCMRGTFATQEQAVSEQRAALMKTSKEKHAQTAVIDLKP